MIWWKPQKTDDRYGTYPCIDYLNIALRSMLKDEKPNRLAISEICHCISHARGKFYDDVARDLTKSGLCPFEIKTTGGQP